MGAVVDLATERARRVPPVCGVARCARCGWLAAVLMRADVVDPPCLACGARAQFLDEDLATLFTR